MKLYPLLLAAALALAGAVLFSTPARAQDRTPPATAAEKEAVYALSLEHRALDILTELALTDQAKISKVHDLVIAQYRALRARDETLDADLKSGAKNAMADAQKQTKKLHDDFLANLSAVLTPEQVEKVKDKMTYGKVKFTYDAYCNIIPGLTDPEKTKVMELLKQARDEAIDGGSAPAKSAIFQKYKDQINSYLTAQGHDVDKALKDWAAKQEMAKKAKDDSQKAQ
jgi:Spy/CpxP family protein refolding chaperone